MPDPDAVTSPYIINSFRLNRAQSRMKGVVPIDTGPIKLVVISAFHELVCS